MGLPDQVELPYIDGYDYGIGVNYPGGGPKNLAVEGEKSGVGDAPRGTVRFNISRVTSMSDMEEALKISAGASFGFASFGAGAQARFDFARNAKISNSSLVLVVSAEIELGFKQIDQPKLNSAALQFKNNAKQFAETFGNMFVRGLSSGGLFLGYLRVDTGSSSLSQSIAAEIGGGYGAFKANASTVINKVQQEYKSEVQLKLLCEGGPIPGIRDLTDPDQLLRAADDFAKAFETQPDASAKPYSVTIAPLVIALAPPPPNDVDLQHASDVITYCARRRSTLIDELNTYQYMLDHEQQFDWSQSVNPQQLGNAVGAVQGDLDLIASCASYATDHPEDAKNPEEYAPTQHVTYPRSIPKPSPLPEAKPATKILDLSSYVGAWLATDQNGSLERLTMSQTESGFSITFEYRDGSIHSADGIWDEAEQAITASVNAGPAGEEFLSGYSYVLRATGEEPRTLLVSGTYTLLVIPPRTSQINEIMQHA